MTIGVVLIGELDEFDGHTTLQNESDTHARGGRVGCNEDVPAGEFGGEVFYFEGDVRNGAHEFGDRCIRLKAQPFEAKFALTVADDVGPESGEILLTGSRFSAGDPEVVITAHKAPWAYGNRPDSVETQKTRVKFQY